MKLSSLLNILKNASWKKDLIENLRKQAATSSRTKSKMTQENKYNNKNINNNIEKGYVLCMAGLLNRIYYRIDLENIIQLYDI